MKIDLEKNQLVFKNWRYSVFENKEKKSIKERKNDRKAEKNLQKR